MKILVLMILSIALFLTSTFSARAEGYVTGGVKKGVKHSERGVKKGIRVSEGGVKKGVRVSVGGTKKGIKETKKFVRKVF